jgi:cytidylate kinase
MPPTEGLHKLVERQVRSWEAHQRFLEQERRLSDLKMPYGPWLSISRQFGSGGTDLAARLATRLGWTVYDRELLARIAAAEHVPAAEMARRDEHPSHVLDEVLSSLVVPHDAGQAAYLQQMFHVVGEIGRRGKAIIVGRGANWFLREAYGVRVRVVAPVAYRVERVRAAEEVPLATARKRVLLNDDEQRAFMRQVYLRDVDDPLGYDLVINLGAVDVEIATDVVVAAIERKFARP